MAATLTKPTLEITGSEAENTMRKNVYAAAVGIQDATLSNLSQPLVHITLSFCRFCGHTERFMSALDCTFLRTMRHTTVDDQRTS